MIPLRSLTSALFRTVPITAIATTTRTSSPVIVRKKRKSNIMMWSTTAAAMTAAAAATATATTTTLFYYSFIGGVSSLSSLSSSQSLADSTSTSACSFSSLLLLSSSASSLALKNVISSVSSSASVSQASASSLYATLINTLNANTTNCQEGENAVKKSTNTTQPPFDDSVLSYDHYNGVTIHLDKYHHQHQRSNNDDDSSGNQLTTAAAAVTIEIETLFSRKLKDALQIWKSEGKKGIWIHTNSETSKYIPICIELGFQFHKILPSSKSTTATTATTTTEIENEDNNLLVLSQWLPDTRSRLPLGPTHQIGVGVIVLNPLNHSQILVVKEKSGPAAAYDLWKMPTGLLDPNEYVHEGAKRELYEETSLNATLNNIISIRQSHRGNGSTSDMFFVCLMELDNNDINTNDDDNGGNGGNDGDGQQQQQQQWKACEDEIADIQWMSVEEYCNQTIWNNSPLSETLNACVLQVSKNKQQAMIGGSNNVDSIDSSSSSSVSAIEHYQLEVGFGRTDKKTDALFVPKTIINSTPTSLRSDHNNNHLNSSKL
ncbi:MAG: ADP-ribose pyrophosphatase YjhB (NUDIX family) [Bacillariaceae sp.]|jgi:ADP-ribose pyrophosphatase YjhB (NUDIX family)